MTQTNKNDQIPKVWEQSESGVALRFPPHSKIFSGENFSTIV